MKQAVPVFAYYAKMYAITKGFDLVKNAPAGTDVSKVKEYLIGELSDCE